MALDFKNLDLANITFDDLVNAQAAVKAGLVGFILVGILAAGYFFVWSSGFEEIESKARKEAELRSKYASERAKVIHLEAYKKRLEDMEKSLAAMLRQLPNKAEMDALLTDINQTGIGRGLEFQLFKPGQETKVDNTYARMPVTIKVLGTYHDIAYFVSDLAGLPRIVTLHDVVLAPTRERADGLQMDANLNTYRYLDTSEVAPAAPAKKGGR